jgi:hypothetical protein
MEGRLRKGTIYVLLSVAVVALMTVLGACGDDDNPPPPAPVTYSISGTVSGAIVSGVTVSLTGASAAATTTDGSGSYSFSGLANGAYTITPLELGYTFDPVNRAVNVGGANVTGMNFTAASNFNNASLNGLYYLMMPMISKTSTTVSYDEIAGPANFNGTSSVTVTGTSRRVDVDAMTSAVTITTEVSTMTYSVDPVGSFTLTTPDNQTLTGQIVLSGNAVLLDGTARTDQTELTGQLVGMKSVTSGLTPTYDNASLNGAYLFSVTEVHDPGTLTYCDQAGTVTFNGAGSVTVNGTSRCSDGAIVTTPTLSFTIDYAVNPDGSFTITDPGAPGEAVHGQIVLDGSSLLFDGTMQGTSANDYLDHGVAMKRITAGSPPTYADASLNGTYLFMLTEITGSSFCDQAGTMSFDGAGSVTVAGTNRCSDGATVTTSPKTETINYSVNADGSFTINASGPKPLHGQIVLDGRSLLVDGTMQGSSANDFLNNGVAMKR